MSWNPESKNAEMKISGKEKFGKISNILITKEKG
jgi:hypothetical protein